MVDRFKQHLNEMAMTMMKLYLSNKMNLLRIILYGLGLFVTAFGIILIIRTNLGAGPWDTVNYNLHVLTGITIGTASFLINTSIVVFVVLYNKNPKFFISMIPVLSLSLFIDFWDILIFGTYYPTGLIWRLFLIVLGAFILTFGLALVVMTRYPAMVFEELTFVVMRMFKTKSFLIARIFIETLAITIATILGFTASIGFGAVGPASIIMAALIGPMVSFHARYMSHFTKQTLSR